MNNDHCHECKKYDFALTALFTVGALGVVGASMYWLLKEEKPQVYLIAAPPHHPQPSIQLPRELPAPQARGFLPAPQEVIDVTPVRGEESSRISSLRKSKKRLEKERERRRHGVHHPDYEMLDDDDLEEKIDEFDDVIQRETAKSQKREQETAEHERQIKDRLKTRQQVHQKFEDELLGTQLAMQQRDIIVQMARANEKDRNITEDEREARRQVYDSLLGKSDGRTL